MNPLIIATQKTITNPATITGNPNVSFLLAGENPAILTNGLSNLIGDTSSNNISLTATGSPSVGTFSPYGSNWSVYFNGSSYINFASSSNFGFGAGNFTVEFWAYHIAYPTSEASFIDFRSAVIATSTAIGMSTSGQPFYYDGPPDNTYSGSNPISLNVWNHWALVRQSGVWNLYINGTSVATSTNSDNLNATNPCRIGWNINGTTGGEFNGYISNFRVIVGTTVYTGNFTPPTTPLNTITNTTMLMNGNNINDVSGNNSAPTVGGVPKIVRLSPFNNGAPTSHTPALTGTSVYFNGSSYLTGAGTSAEGAGSSAFTIEGYMYVTSLPANGSANTAYIFQKGSAAVDSNFEFGIYLGNNSGAYYMQIEMSNNGSSVTSFNSNTISVQANGWYHFAITKSSTNINFWFNGQAAGTSTGAYTSLYSGDGSFYVGSNAAGSGPMPNGYLTDIRYVVGSALYTVPFPPPTSSLTSITGTQFLLGSQKTSNNWCVVYDSAGECNILPKGSTISNTQSKFNGTSLYFNGSTYLLADQNSANNIGSFGTFDFTVEAWVYNLSSSPGYIIDARSSGSGGNWCFYGGNGTNSLSWYNNSTITSSGVPIPLNAWVHVAMVRHSGTSTLYVNGVQGTSWSDTTNYVSSTTSLTIGAEYLFNASSYFWWDGYICDLRIANTAMYTANFTPPTSSFIGK